MKNIILCKPGKVPVCQLNGVDYNTINYTAKFNDLDEITFTVDKYITLSDGESVKSNGYDSIHAFMEVYVEDIGYFQIKEPDISNEINKETKTVTGVSIATELLQKDLVGLTVNTSTAASLEMLADNNINSLGYPNEYITFYNPTNKQLSLLDLVLEKAVGWSVGTIDDFLKNQRYSFDNINENIFSFLTKTLSSTARCIFTFDTINKTVSAYSENHIGNDTGIVIAERNLLNSVNVQCDSDNIYTRINVQGKDSLNFADINYGDTHIFNLDYYSNLSYMNQDLIDALKTWQKARDDNRDSYIRDVKIYQGYLEQISEIDNKVPTNGVLNNWDNMSIDELNKNLTYYNSLIKEFQIIAQNTHPKAGETEYTGNLDDYTPSRLKADGTVDHDAYMNDLDGQGKETYREIITYVIPNIEIAIENFDLTKDEKKDYFEDYLTDWDLYGLVELKAKQSSYEDQISTLKSYQKDWSKLTKEEKASHGDNEITYNQYHNEYEKLDGYIKAIKSKSVELQTQKDNLVGSRDALSKSLATIRNNMSITGGRNVNGVFVKWFTDSQLQTVNLLFHDTDYTNENILVTKLNNFSERLDIEKELYKDAEEELSELAVPQYTFSCTLDNLLSMDEFNCWHNDFKIGNFITLEVSEDVFTKLRLISISYNPFIKTNDLSVEFSNMVTGKDGRNDFSYIFDKAISASKNSITLSNNSAKDDLELSVELLNLISNSTVFKGKFDELNYKNISANEATIVKLTADFIKSDFADFTDAQIKNLYANTGLITDLTVKDGKITGKLCAVEIDAGNIKTGTLMTDRLLIKGNNSLYYKLNVTALGKAVVEELPADEQEKLKNGIHGENIIAESITANKIAVSDLTAFKATIASFKIEDLLDTNGNVVGGSFHNILKTSVDSHIPGVYIDSNGQFVLGNDDEYIKFVKTPDGNFAFDIKTNVKVDGSLLIDGTITSDKIHTGSITTDKIQANSITSDKIATGAITIGSLDSGLKSSIDSINNLSVGGRNISLGTSLMTIGTGGYAKSQWRKFSTGDLGSTNITDFSGIFNGVKLSITNASSQVGVVQDNVPLKKGTQYVVSFWARCVSGDSCVIATQCYSRSGDADTTSLFTVASDWTRIVKVASNKPLSDNNFTAPLIVLRPANVGTSVEICGIKLEKGTIATDWTPAPEDTTNQILDNSIANWCYNNNKTYIDGAKIYTGTITADAIATKSITSGKIDVSELSAISVNLGTVKAGVIESDGYKKDTKGMRISLNDGTLDSKNFSIDAQGNVSIDGTIYATNGTLSNLLIVGSKGIACEYEMGAGSGSTKQTVRISEGKISFGNIYTSQDGQSRTDTGTYIYQTTSGIAFESESGEAYFKVSSMSSSALYFNNNSYVMINKQGLITANGSYLNSRDSSGNIVRLIALTTSNHFHIGNTDIPGNTRILCGATGLIQFYTKGISDGTMTRMAEFSQNSFTMPAITKIGVMYKNTSIIGFQQRYDDTLKTVGVGNNTSTVSISGLEVTISGVNSITANRTITVSSDKRVKNHIADLPSGSENLFDYLDGKSFFYNGDSSTAKNYGFIAQDVLSALQKCGLTTDDFAGFCDINGDGSQYALAYEQFIPIMWEEIKRLRNQVKELKGE
ncbi:tail fiber domain-containing protein [Leyella stercorea]|uniref:tail fiber domain-containing protein n=1 Tax=Leyella stercorea TaxID=363265 RepID=UPI002432F629|nr:tail fiber domain-containing protein [Leyella stercorea]